VKIDNRTILYGVFGGTVEHSLSPLIHNASFESLGFNCVYLGFGVPPEKLRQALFGAQALGFGGLSITIPHKAAVMEMCDEVDPAAKMIGAVNTIEFTADGKIIGYNTDGIGVARALKECGVMIKGRKVMVLGAGGAARGVVFQLAKEGAKKITILNRTIARAENLTADVGRAFGNDIVEWAPFKPEVAQKNAQESDLIINTTSIGMYPDVDRNPLEGVTLSDDVTVFDIVYNPMRTKLLNEAERAGADTVTGDLMLVYQAVEQERIWLGIEPPAGTMLDVMRNALTPGNNT